MPPNAAAPKSSDIPRKTQTHKHYLVTARDMITYNFIETVSPTLMLPRKPPNTQEQPLSRTTTTDHLILLPSLLVSPTIINITMILILLII